MPRHENVVHLARPGRAEWESKPQVLSLGGLWHSVEQELVLVVVMRAIEEAGVDALLNIQIQIPIGAADFVVCPVDPRRHHREHHHPGGGHRNDPPFLRDRVG